MDALEVMNASHLRSHEVLTLDKYMEIESRGHLIVESKVFCSVHKDSHLEFYCDTCQVPVCYKCTIVEHRVPEHIHKNLHDVADEYKTQLKEMLGQLKVKEKQVEKEKSVAESTREEIQNQCKAEKLKVLTRAKEMIERVKREQKKLIDALDERSLMRLKDVAMRINERKFHLGNIVSTHHYLETLVHHGNPVHLLSTRTETMKRINEMVAMETKPPIIHDITKYDPRSDLAAHALMGVIKSDVCQSKCTVENIPKQLPKGESVKLLITTRDSRGKQIIPRQDVTVKSKNPDASWEDIDVTDNYNGTFQVMIVEKMVETHQVAVTIGNQHIPGSPFHIPVIRLVQKVGKTGEGQLSYPLGLTINKNDEFVTADRGNKRVTIHDRAGNYRQSFRFTDQFAKPFIPCDVAISDDNEYFMLDDSNNQIVVSDENGKMIRKFDKNDYVYVSSEHKVTKHDIHGRFICRIDSEKDRLSYPYGLAVCDDCKLAVVDYGNTCINIFVE
uniref:E3 ubiquitin-protein ligase TRIM71-like n=1 Tax=Saccoglossus kowalevskii TaxID=10224 RepID=A0ABM0MFU4_SACKO|nr:PREDICTED: E3 ubiquitin-protein ligase TRIM71-like [Saccoglossus kowalevskii]